MSNDDGSDKKSASPAQLALIGVLSIILIGAIYWNLFRGASESTTAARSGRRTARAAAQTNDANPKRSAEMQQLAARLNWKSKPWPDYQLADVTKHDPFAAPSTFPRSPAAIAAAGPGDSDVAVEEDVALRAQHLAERAAAIDAIREKGVQVVLKSENEIVAVIGDREVRVGDAVEGYTVVHIDASGVTLNREKVQ